MEVGEGSTVEEVGQWLQGAVDGLQDAENTVELFSDAGLDGRCAADCLPSDEFPQPI